MSDKVERLGGAAAHRAADAAARKAARAAARLELDALMDDARFGAFMERIAERAGYFSAEAPRDEWTCGYRAALRDLVNGVVMNSSRGAAWLSAYAAGKAENREKTEEQK